MATEVVELTGDEAGLLRSLDNAIAKENAHEQQLGKTAAAGAEAGDALEEAFEKVSKSDDKALKGLLRDLNRISPEARKVGGALKDHFVEAGKAGYKSIDQVIEEIRKIDPEAAAAAEAMRDELAAAADDVGNEIEQTANKGSKSWDDFTKDAVTKIGTMVLAYASVGTAVQAVTGFMRDQKELMDLSLDATQRLAIAQQEAQKNLAGLSVIHANDLLQGFVPEVAAETGFGDLGRITSAVGSAASAGGTVSDIKNVVSAAAQVTRFTPEALDEFSAAAIDLKRATGSSSAEANIGFLLSSGTQARVTDPQQLAKNLAPAVVSSVATVRGQQQDEAAREAAAIYGVLTKAATDKEGAATKTATIQLTAKLNEFFAEQESDPGTLFGRIGSLQADPELRESLFAKPFGEAAYQQAFKDLADGSTDLAAELKTAKEQISVDRSVFDDQVSRLTRGTPQLAISDAVSRFDAGVISEQSFNSEKAALGAVRQIYSEALTNSTTGFMESIANNTYGSVMSWGGLPGSTAAEEAVSAIEEFAVLRRDIEADGVDFDEQNKLVVIDSAIKSLEALVINVDPAQVAPGSIAAAARDARSNITPVLPEFGLSPEETARQERLNATFERIASTLEAQLAATKETAANTSPRPGDPAAAQRASMDLANQRASQ